MSSIERHNVPEAVRTELFASKRRCRLLRALAGAGGDASVSDLVEQICAAEPDTTDTTDEVRYDLYDHHLPKLAATGVVEYDSALDKLRLLDFAAARTAGETLSE
ncbi:DUF7344 domain-containing protein [Halovenus halobia]|uniref:DUF7344 domain-containing protein n=1 Tax=Halovenus halobia TaxID=3396622 RepID=UPI003F542C42